MATGISSYLLAADNHNLINTGTSWADPETWTAKLGNAGKFISVATLSGANSLYNSAAQIGSWLGADTQQNDTARWIADLDTDLGTYYRANKESADLVGFVAGRFFIGAIISSQISV